MVLVDLDQAALSDAAAALAGKGDVLLVQADVTREEAVQRYVSETLGRKLDAFRCFQSQVRPFPEERSIEALEALARSRGATVHVKAAEAFMNVRQIIR